MSSEIGFTKIIKGNVTLRMTRSVFLPSGSFAGQENTNFKFVNT